MTENKRYTMEKSEGQDTIYDWEGIDDYYHLGNDTRDVKAICDTLNKQEETIQDLKTRNNRQYKLLKKITDYMYARDWKALEQMVEEWEEADRLLQAEFK